MRYKRFMVTLTAALGSALVLLTLLLFSPVQSGSGHPADDAFNEGGGGAKALAAPIPLYPEPPVSPARPTGPTQSPQIFAKYEMNGRNTVFGFNAVASSTVLITITHPVSGVIATGNTVAGTCNGCNPTGYQLDFPDWTLTAGVSVTVNGGPGMVESVEVVSITGDPNINTDIVIGSAPPEGQLNSFVYRTGDRADIDSVLVDASGVYTLDFGAVGWDILPGDEFHVYYSAPGGHVVESVFWLPVPQVSVSKAYVSGFARPGGKVVYRLSYWNDGGAIAEDVVVVDTLPVSTTWAGDTSGLTPEVGASGVITWHLGALPAPGNGDNGDVIMVTLDVAADMPIGGALGANCATISTSTPGDPNPGDNTSCSGPVDVQDSDVGVNVDKWPNPGDPAPGQEFVYTIRWCSDYGANFGPVWLTDTLPVSTTVSGWSTDAWWGHAFWTEIITTGGQFVLYAPGLPGNWCEHITLRLLVAPNAPEEMLLSNHVMVATPGDAQPDNNERLNEDARTSNPRLDLHLTKSLNSGLLVPGGWINDFINYENRGNMAALAWVTETVPAGLTFESAWWGGGQPDANQPLPAPTVVGDQLVWDLGELPVNGAHWFHVQMNITDTLEAGDTITNCAFLSINPGERTPEDNYGCYAVTLNPTGPNLQVTKESWWNGNRQLGYRIHFFNMGDATIPNVWITDTLPAGTAWDGWRNLGFDANRLAEEVLDSDVLAWRFSELYPGDSGQIEFNANLDEPGVPLRWFTNTVEITLPDSDINPADNVYEDVAFSGGELQWVDVDVYRTRIWGCAPQGPVTVTTALAEMTFGNCWNENNFPDTFDPGDVVTITAGAGQYPVVVAIPDPFTGQTSSVTDTVWGQIGALDHAQVQVDMWDLAAQWTETDAQGHYSVSYPDISHGAQGDVNYYTEIGYAQVGFHHRLLNPDLIVTVDYGNNGVDANYERGHTGWVTVTNGPGTEIKATVLVTTELWPWWGGNSGFSTHHHPWTPEQPDIQPNDWVYAMLDNGYGAAVQVGTINAALDVAGDVVSGTLDVPWLSAGVQVRCEIHENNAPGIEVRNVDPQGGAFFCDFGGMWDITPGQNVAVRYTGPDGNQVMARPANPAPHLRVEKRLESGNLGEGSNAVFYVQYRNEGDTAAENVVITDTLQGMTYLTDTSGFPLTGSGGQIALDLGEVAPSDWIQFYVFAQITAAAGERVTNTVAIATSSPFDQGGEGEKWNEWNGEVQPNDTRLNIGKSSWTGDPAAGYDIVFQVSPCNNGGTASSDVTITDTLHPSMTLQAWWSDSAGWAEVNRSTQQLLLTRPAILGGGRCENVYVRATVDADAWPGMFISNTATIYAANDLSADDDEAGWGGTIAAPRINLLLDKQWNWGQLTPGGELRYTIYYNNTGNVPVGAFRITDTLPVSTTFDSARQNGQPFMPALIDDGMVVWEFAGLGNGYANGLEVILNVDSAAAPGILLVNTAEITCLPGEETCDDNTDSWTETLFDHGPNLRLTKWGDWHGDRPGHAWYQFRVENVGDVAIAQAVLTDTYPLLMALEGGINTDWSRVANYTENSAEHWSEFTLNDVWPGYRLDFSFNTTMNAPVAEGLTLTNTVAAAPIPGDTNSADDRADYILTTGPDLYVKKTLIGGVVRPGELVTFSLRFGNDQPGHTGWWNMQGNARLTDVLPTSLTYISAKLRYCNGSEWCDRPPDVQVGSVQLWLFDPLNTGAWNELYLTARIPYTATGLDTFTNRVDIASSQPNNDTEPDYANNHATLALPVDLPYFEVSKAYESTMVARSPITYTLTVTNSGNGVGTGVILSDTIPAGLTDVGGGTIEFGMARWLFDLIGAGDTATAELTGALPCAGTVVNDDYRVTESDQSVGSDPGAPVIFDVFAPTFAVGFDQSGATGPVSTTFTFTDTSTTNGPAIVEWRWDFDDGQFASGPTASHTYTTDGAFNVSLTVTDTCGYAATAVSVILVAPPTLAASFDQSAAAVKVGATAVFTDTSTTNVPPIVAWAWDFGDESALAFGPTVTHLYTGAGVFTVTLTITDSLGYSDMAEAAITVTTGGSYVYLPLVMR